jgi:hypothetical protein
MPDAPTPCQGPKPVFYLILKGEIAISVGSDGLLLLAPELPEHSYAAGPWLAETHVPRHAKLELRGATGSGCPPTNLSELVITLPNPEPHPGRARFQVSVPFPRDILPGAVAPTKDMHITVVHDDGSTVAVKPPDATCVVMILVYDWDGLNQPFLCEPGHCDPTKDRIWPAGGRVPCYRSLHVCASGETQAQEITTTMRRALSWKPPNCSACTP